MVNQSTMPKMDMLHEIKVYNAIFIASLITVLSIILLPIGLILALIGKAKENKILSTRLYTDIAPGYDKEEVLRAIQETFDRRWSPDYGEGDINYYRKLSLGMGAGCTLSVSVVEENGKTQAVLWMSKVRNANVNGSTQPAIKGVIKQIKTVCRALAPYTEDRAGR